jgi:hypothetical protein
MEKDHNSLMYYHLDKFFYDRSFHGEDLMNDNFTKEVFAEIEERLSVKNEKFASLPEDDGMARGRFRIMVTWVDTDFWEIK